MNISLKGYNKLIEDLVEKNQIDEAIAHCRHILKEFPNHIDTRRILAGAYLDARKYALAKDIFQEVLMAVPADFVANLGMSFVYSVEGDLEYAIWHMERAFEKNPNNIGIQDELKKLYTTRYGITPERINKTSGVLASLYFNSGEYDKAETEIIEILKTDITRREMKTLLAKIYFLQGNLELASETCLDCFKHSPNNFEANRLMIKILQKTNSIQNLDVYRTRLQELDPYAIHPGSFLLAEELLVPEEAIQIGKLDWSEEVQPDALPIEPQAESPQPATPADSSAPEQDSPASTIEPIDGVVSEEPGSDGVPAWLKDLMHPDSTPAQTEPDGAVPSWVMEIEPDTEPASNQDRAAAQTPPFDLTMNNQPSASSSTVAPNSDSPSKKSEFDLADWTDSTDIFDDPEITSAVAKVLDEMPTDEDLELMAETKPNLFSITQPIKPTTTPEVDAGNEPVILFGDGWKTLTSEEPIEQIPPEPEPALNDQPEAHLIGRSEPDLTDQPEPITLPQPDELPESTEALPDYTELDWLGDLGKHSPDPEEPSQPAANSAIPEWMGDLTPAGGEQPDHAADQPAIQLQPPSPSTEPTTPEWLGDLSTPAEPVIEEADEPVIPELAAHQENPAPTPTLRIPDMPNITLPDHIHFTRSIQPQDQVEEPVEEITAAADQNTDESNAESTQPEAAAEPISEPESDNGEFAVPTELSEGDMQGMFHPETTTVKDDENGSEAALRNEMFNNLDDEVEEVIEEIVSEEETSHTETPTISPWIPVEQDLSAEPLPNSAPNAELEPIIEIEPEKETELGSEADPDLDTEPESEPESESELETETIGEPVSELEPESEAEPEPETEPELEEIPDLDGALGSETEPYTDPAALQMPGSDPAPEPKAEPPSAPSNEAVIQPTPDPAPTPIPPQEMELIDDPSVLFGEEDDPEDEIEEEVEEEAETDLSELAELDAEEPLPDETDPELNAVDAPEIPDSIPEKTPAPEVEAPAEEEFDEVLNLQSEDLAKAAAFLTSGNIDAALDEFSALIKQESHLPEVIHHLEDLAKKQELNKKVWRTLGDAYFNANHLQQALDAYSHADGLIDTDDSV